MLDWNRWDRDGLGWPQARAARDAGGWTCPIGRCAAPVYGSDEGVLRPLTARSSGRDAALAPGKVTHQAAAGQAASIFRLSARFVTRLQARGVAASLFGLPARSDAESTVRTSLRADLSMLHDSDAELTGRSPLSVEPAILHPRSCDCARPRDGHADPPQMHACRARSLAVARRARGRLRGTLLDAAVRERGAAPTRPGTAAREPSIPTGLAKRCPLRAASRLRAARC